MNEIKPVTPRTKKLGLMPRRTGLPCVLWLLPAVADAAGVLVEVTTTQAYDKPTTYQVAPYLLRLKGPYRWLDMAALGHFRHDNLRLMEEYWRGRQIDGTAIVEAIKPLDPTILESLRFRDQAITAWADSMERRYQKTGIIDREYQMHRRLTHPEDV